MYISYTNYYNCSLALYPGIRCNGEESGAGLRMWPPFQNALPTEKSKAICTRPMIRSSQLFNGKKVGRSLKPVDNPWQCIRTPVNRFAERSLLVIESKRRRIFLFVSRYTHQSRAVFLSRRARVYPTVISPFDFDPDG